MHVRYCSLQPFDFNFDLNWPCAILYKSPNHMSTRLYLLYTTYVRTSRRKERERSTVNNNNYSPKNCQHTSRMLRRYASYRHKQSMTPPLSSPINSYLPTSLPSLLLFSHPPWARLLYIHDHQVSSWTPGGRVCSCAWVRGDVMRLRWPNIYTYVCTQHPCHHAGTHIKPCYAGLMRR